MKWKYYTLPENAPEVREHVLLCLSVGAQKCTLNKKLIARIANADGSAFAIAMESLDLECLIDFQSAGTYAGGSLLYESPLPNAISIGCRPMDGLVDFLNALLRASKEAVVLCPNSSATRATVFNLYVPTSRLLFFSNEVYHVLEPEDANHDAIAETVRESGGHFGFGVCSFAAHVPQNDIAAELFLDDIVTNTSHIFVRAFDGDGYLIWSLDGQKGPEKKGADKVSGTNGTRASC